ncbi:MAG: hypothetical protein ACREON_07035 [Gemmatimonadaceae bacterium]
MDELLEALDEECQQLIGGSWMLFAGFQASAERFGREARAAELPVDRMIALVREALSRSPLMQAAPDDAHWAVDDAVRWAVNAYYTKPD